MSIAQVSWQFEEFLRTFFYTLSVSAQSIRFNVLFKLFVHVLPCNINYISGKGRFNLYTLFIERGYNILGKKGTLSYIIPDNLYSNIEYRFTRKLLSENTIIHKICLFSTCSKIKNLLPIT